MLDSVAQCGPIPSEQTIEDEHAGDAKRGSNATVQPTHGRQDAEVSVEEQLEEQTQPEDRHCCPGDCDYSRNEISTSTARCCREYPERNAHEDVDKHGQESQFKGGREIPPDVIHDGLACSQGSTQVPSAQSFQIEEELRIERFVKAHHLSQSLNLLGCSLKSSGNLCWIGWYDPRDKESYEGNPKDHRNEKQQPLNYVDDHAISERPVHRLWLVAFDLANWCNLSLMPPSMSIK